MAMVNAAGHRIGERVAADVPPMRIILMCTADVSKRRIKIRRGKNKQDAWLPQDTDLRGEVSHDGLSC